MRRSYLVCYDVREPRRLQRTRKLLKGYGSPLQYSVFLCVLKDIDRVRMENELRGLLNLRQDDLLIVDLGADETAAREMIVTLGPGGLQPATGTVVI